MNRIIITLCLAFAAMLSTGCKKYLKETSQDELTPETTSSLSELLAKEGYPYIGTSITSPSGYSFCNYLNWMDDDVHIQNYSLNTTNLVPYSKPYYAWSDNMYVESAAGAWTQGANNPYQNLYNRIRGCNAVMDMLPDVSGTDADKDQIMGEALTLRAWYYFMLVNLYGWPYNDSTHPNSSSPGVPLLTRGDISDAAIPRSTVKQVYDFMTADIEKAISLLEKKRTMSTLFRINYRSAWLLASRIYLFMEQWDKVLAYTNKLIGEYPIITDLNTLKVPVTQALSFLNNINFIDPSTSEMLFLSCAARGGDWASMNVGASPIVVLASAELTNIYETNDMRFGVYNSTNPPPNFYLTRQSGYYMHSKYYVNGVAGRCFRMSEAYVNRAEAIIRMAIQGNGSASLQAAIDDLNYLRAKRFKVGSANAAVTLASFGNDPRQVLQFCMTERRREFCFEEFRWFDLRRYGMPSIVHTFNYNEPSGTSPNPIETYTLQKGSNRYVMKIPQNAMDANPALVQNP